jgi:hypothetical protein
MKSLITLAICLPLLVAGCGSPPPADGGVGALASASIESPAADEQAVRAAFETYMKAALARDGVAAQRVLATTVQGFYDDARKLALTAAEDVVRGLPADLRITVCVMRAEIDPGLLRDGSVEELLVSAFDRGLVGDDVISDMTLGTVTVTGDRALAKAVVGDKPSGFSIQFAREEGKWKVDIAPLMALANQGLAALAKQQGVTVDELADQILVSKYGKAKAEWLMKPVSG